MADNQTNFLEAFKSSLDSLQQFNTNLSSAVATDKQDKDSFLQYVNTELGDINTKIKALEELINKINAELNNLRSASENNTTIISTNDSERALLQQQLAQLQASEAQLREQLTAAQQEAAEKENTIQQQIDEKEAQITQLTASNATLKSQADALNQQLTDRSQTDADQAAAIQKMTEDNKQALEAQASANAAQIQQLQQDIAAKDAQLTELTNTHSTGLASITAELEECKKGKAEIEKEISEITAENNNLKEQNEQYEETIKTATETINSVVTSLNQLLTQIPQAQDRTAIAELFKEINNEIAKLNGLLSGQQLAPVQEAPVQEAPVQEAPLQEGQENQQLGRQGKKGRNSLPDNTPIPINGTTVLLGDIRKMLKAKAEQTIQIPDAQNRHLIALKQLRTASTIVEVQTILIDNNIKWSKIVPGKIDGGRSKKRNAYKRYSTRKKQKGGFTYDKAQQFFGNKKSSSTSKTSKSKSTIGRGRKSTRRSKR